MKHVLRKHTPRRRAETTWDRVKWNATGVLIVTLASIVALYIHTNWGKL